MTFRVGQKVVCISMPRGRAYYGEIYPIVGFVYTIRAIDPVDGDLRFVEIKNAPQHYEEGLTECTFLARRFRPIVERKTDISIFNRMLKPSKVEA